MSEWIGLLGALPGIASLLILIRDKWKQWKTPKPELKAVDSIQVGYGVGIGWFLGIRLRNEGDGWAVVQTITWNLFKGDSKEVVEGQVDYPHHLVIGPNGAEKNVNFAPDSLEDKTKYRVEILFVGVCTIHFYLLCPNLFLWKLLSLLGFS